MKKTFLILKNLKKSRPEYNNAKFICETQNTFAEKVKKMSKSFFNVVNPDKIIEQFGADSLRMYEMFLGPLTQYKPWSTDGQQECFLLKKI